MHYLGCVLMVTLMIAMSTVYHKVQPVFTCRTLQRCQVGVARSGWSAPPPPSRSSWSPQCLWRSSPHQPLVKVGFPAGTRAWVSLAMFLLQVTRRGEIRDWEPFPMGHLISDDNYQIWNRQFLIPLGVTVAAYGLISTHLWGTGHIGAATQQQQVKNENKNKQNNNGKTLLHNNKWGVTTTNKMKLMQKSKWKQESQYRISCWI